MFRRDFLKGFMALTGAAAGVKVLVPEAAAEQPRASLPPASSPEWPLAEPVSLTSRPSGVAEAHSAALGFSPNADQKALMEALTHCRVISTELTSYVHGLSLLTATYQLAQPGAAKSSLDEYVDRAVAAGAMPRSFQITNPASLIDVSDCDYYSTTPLYQESSQIEVEWVVPGGFA